MNIRSNLKAGKLTTNHNEKAANNNKAERLAVKAGIKAGQGSPKNHNEKLADDAGSIEQKKNIGNKLRLNKDTVRELGDSELKLATAEPMCPPFYSDRAKK